MGRLRTGFAGGRVWAAMAAGSLALSGVVVTAGTAAADEVYTRPADGVFVLDGRGYGHGIGMSQHGARAAAAAGLTWRQILTRYYPGTAIADAGNPTIRVRFVGQTALAVRAQAGLRVNLDRNNASSGWRELPASVTSNGASVAVDAWDIAYSSGWQLRHRLVGATAFTVYAAVPATALAVAFDNPTAGSVRQLLGTTVKTYRGELRHLRSGSTSGATVTVVNALAMESYLRAVVPREMPASWAAEALRAQAVAARTYAERSRRATPSSRGYDTCDTTACQVMGSLESEAAATDAAVAATARQIVTYEGAAALTQFSSANGGHSAPGSQPYLVAKPDGYDTYTWRASVAATALEKAWPGVGRVTALKITQRDGYGSWGGRVTQVVIQGSTSSATVSGTTFRMTLGLKSTHFLPVSTGVSAPSFPRDVTSDGRADVVAVVRSTGALRVYAGAGTGWFAGSKTAATSGWSGYRRLFSAGTWDADRVPDLMAVASDGSLRVFRGSGSGTFGAGSTVAPGFGAYNLLFPVGDFDGDRKTDVVGRRTDGTLWLVRGNGSGGLLGQVRIGIGWGGFSKVLSPGDFNGDGRADIVATDSSGQLWMYPGSGSGGFLTRSRIGIGWGSFTSLTSPGDFSGDGKADLIARTSAGALLLYRGSGTGGFGTRSTIGSGWNSLDIVP